MVTVLTIAGSDSCGGAGIQADLKTFLALGVYGASAVTAVTAQNTAGVTTFEALSPALVTAQIDAVLAEGAPSAVKTGMLANREIVEAVAAVARRHKLRRLVLDPVIVATSGARLLDGEALLALRERLIPLAYVVTPNVPEAEALSGVTIRTDADVHEAARRILALGPTAVVIKGGHRPTGISVEDLLLSGEGAHVYRIPREAGGATHGTGCTFGAALAARLATGYPLEDAIGSAQIYVAGAIRHGRDGIGGRLLDHAWQTKTS
jgi:hydroxymethylpyrimidine/phosphomethylpyrimidine kinase